MTRPRQTHRWRTLSEKIRQDAYQAGQTHCALGCGTVLAWGTARRTNSPEADHVIAPPLIDSEQKHMYPAAWEAWFTGPFQVICHGCNASKQRGGTARPPGQRRRKDGGVTRPVSDPGPLTQTPRTKPGKAKQAQEDADLGPLHEWTSPPSRNCPDCGEFLTNRRWCYRAGCGGRQGKDFGSAELPRIVVTQSSKADHDYRGGHATCGCPSCTTLLRAGLTGNGGNSRRW